MINKELYQLAIDACEKYKYKVWSPQDLRELLPEIYGYNRYNYVKKNESTKDKDQRN